MEIRRYLRILASRKWVVVLTAIVTLAVVTLGSFRMTRIYSASALVRIAAGLNSSVTFNDLNYTERLMQTYVQLLKSRPVLEEVIGQLGLHVRPEGLAGMIKVEALTGTELIKISVESTSPQQAAAIANTLGALLVEQGQKMYSGQGKSAREILQEQVTVLEDQLRQDRALLARLPGSTPSPDQPREVSLEDLSAKIQSEEQTYAMLLSQYDKARVDEAMRANSISIVEPAVVPEAPSKPNIKLNLALGVLVGLMGGIGLAFLFENLSPLIHFTDDVEAIAGTPVLGRIPDIETRKDNRQGGILLNNGAVQSPAGEAFRVLSANLLALASEARPKTISTLKRKNSVPPLSGLFSEVRPKTVLISSAEPRAGKTTVVVNLAAAIAQAGRQVIVVDGDLRNPSVHKVLDVLEEPGLSDVILNPSHIGSAVQETKVQGVRVLACGSSRTDPAVVLSAPAMPEVIQKLADEADIVLWDSPPILAAADVALLAPMVDGVVLVVERAQTQRETFHAACQQLADVKAKLIGIVVNRAERGSRYNYYHPRPTQNSWWASMLKGTRNIAPNHPGREHLNGKEK
jgi:non-specific protein-tyrosine kinase